MRSCWIGVTRPLPRGVASATGVYAARAENAEIWDVEGKRYIDFAGGIAVLNTGHRHPKVMAAAREQLERFTHTAFQVLAYEPYIALCERLNKLAPFKGPAKTVLFTTGAEATENADQDRARRHQAHRRHRLHRRLPRPHLADHGDDRQDAALQEELRADAGGGLPCALPDRASRGHGRGFPEGPAVPVQGRYRAEPGRGHHHRAGAGRGRLLHRARRAAAWRCAGSATSTASC